jgi:6-pyruvoyltetrahydropterin/6-carboxytetrahydropterin synthase
MNTTLHLFKQNFKFSSAHFLIFDETRAEKLHGHNYQVRVDIGCPSEEKLSKKGYFVDFNEIKKSIKERLDQWDEMVLLPQKHKDILVKKKNSSLELRFRERFYVFPANEVVLLPITNTSVEQLSRLLAEEFYGQFKKWQVKFVRVRVEETRGQGASTLVGQGKGLLKG